MQGGAPEHGADRFMRRWVLPTLFTAVGLFCLALATRAALERVWPAVVVLAAVALGLVALARDARRT